MIVCKRCVIKLVGERCRISVENWPIRSRCRDRRGKSFLFCWKKKKVIEWLMISENREVTRFKHVFKTLDSAVNSEKFPVVYVLYFLCVSLKFFWKENQGLALSSSTLYTIRDNLYWFNLIRFKIFKLSIRFDFSTVRSTPDLHVMYYGVMNICTWKCKCILKKMR